MVVDAVIAHPIKCFSKKGIHLREGRKKTKCFPTFKFFDPLKYEQLIFNSVAAATKNFYFKKKITFWESG